MERIVLLAMAVMLGIGPSGTVSADGEDPLSPNPPSCSTNLAVMGHCYFRCEDGDDIEWIGTATGTITGHAECGGQETPECTTTNTCTRESPDPGIYDNFGKCQGTGAGFITCRSFPSQGV